MLTQHFQDFIVIGVCYVWVTPVHLVKVRTSYMFMCISHLYTLLYSVLELFRLPTPV